MQKTKLIALLIFLCMVLTACAIRAAAKNQTMATTQMTIPPATYELLNFSTIDSVPPQYDPTVDGPICVIPLTSADVLTEAPETTTKPETTAKPVTTTKPETTAKPVTTTKPETTTKPVTTAKPVTAAKPVTTTKPVTTVEPMLPETPKAEEVVGRVPASPAADPSWFDDVVFLGDSITVGLFDYAKNGALGKAQFYATVGYSLLDATNPVTAPGLNLYYDGMDTLPEDCVAKSGAKKVYIMLGINDMYYGVDATVERYRKLISKIREKTPDVEIFIQSITPMTSTSTIADKRLNNDNIKLYNQKVERMCEELGLYFVNVASVMYDDAGVAFRQEYCSDKNSMGLHYTKLAYARQVEYLLTHTLDFSQTINENKGETNDEIH